MNEPTATNDRFRRSAFTQHLELDAGRTLLSHAFRLRRSVVSSDIKACLDAFAPRPLSRTEFVARVNAPEALTGRIFDLLVAEGWIVPEALDEAQFWRTRLAESALDPGAPLRPAEKGRTYRLPGLLQLESFRDRFDGDASRLEPLHVLILGGCLSQLCADPLERLAPSFGLSARVTAGFPDNFALIEQSCPHLLIFQPGTWFLLGSLLDGGALLGPEERRERLETVKTSLTIEIEKLAAHLAGRLLLVQGISLPTLMPAGRLEFRSPLSLGDVVREVNDHLRNLIRDQPNALFLDEEALFSAHGKAGLLDDALVTYGHHGPLEFISGRQPGGPDRFESLGLGSGMRSVELLAEEYLACWTLWRGRAAIKCIVVDLDNTLWPGVVGEDAERILASDALEVLFRTFRFGIFGGIHQALQILRSRGVLLAVCSRNTETHALAHWNRLAKFAKETGIEFFLRPEDFTLLRINWEPKSANVREIAATLGFGLDAVLFVDDSAVERQEVKRNAAGVRVLGEDMNQVRGRLLSDPCLQTPATEQARARPAQMAAQLNREKERAAATDEDAFLEGLHIKLRIRPLSGESDLLRGVELLQRTNQFNTTLLRLDAETLRRRMSAGDPVFMLEASDRFAAYGLVGLCLLGPSSVDAVVLSCRVIGLKPAVPFLVTALEMGNKVAPGLTGRVVDGPRNQPCRTLFADAGFETIGDGCYELRRVEALPTLNSKIYRIEA